MRKISLLLLISLLLSPLGGHAASGILDASTAVSSLNLLIAQYESRIKQLEGENMVLRNEMVKANIKIPLVDYSGAINTPLPTAYPSTPITTSTVSQAPLPTTPTPVVVKPATTTVSSEATNLSDITTKYGKDPAGFISQINKDWSSIKDFYKLSPRARIAGYEFVQSGSLDHVFVDIIVGTGTTGVYDMKMLYQFEKTAYKRKLIGTFQYVPETGKYATTQGTNPFAGVPRTFIGDPYYVGSVSVPPTVSGVPAGSPTTSPSPSSPATSPASTISAPVVGSVTLADITKAYTEKKYLSTITLSNTYLEKNKPTPEILNIRYRTFFIIGKYTESLAEVASMESIGALDRQTACNAQVIATYSKNTTLVSKYQAVCSKK